MFLKISFLSQLYENKIIFDLINEFKICIIPFYNCSGPKVRIFSNFIKDANSSFETVVFSVVNISYLVSLKN